MARLFNFINRLNWRNIGQALLMGTLFLLGVQATCFYLASEAIAWFTALTFFVLYCATPKEKPLPVYVLNRIMYLACAVLLTGVSIYAVQQHQVEFLVWALLVILVFYWLAFKRSSL